MSQVSYYAVKVGENELYRTDGGCGFGDGVVVSVCWRCYECCDVGIEVVMWVSV